MIEIDGLTKRYGDKTAVDRLSFVVEPGVVTGFLGPNGAGKSTTMRMIAGLDRPTSGTVRVNGKHYPEAAAPMSELGILLDARSVHPGLSARNNLLALARTAGIGRRRVDEVIELAGLARGRGHAGRRLLPRHGTAPGRGRGAAGPAADRGAGRAGQRPGPGRRALDPAAAQVAGRRRADGFRLLAPDERDGADRDPAGRAGPRPAHQPRPASRISPAMPPPAASWSAPRKPRGSARCWPLPGSR